LQKIAPQQLIRCSNYKCFGAPWNKTRRVWVWKP